MERLTGWDKQHAYNLKCFENSGCEDMGTSKCDFCDHHIAIYDRLAAYEDTCLTPEECAEFVHEGLPAALDKLAAYESTGVQPEEVLILAGIKYLAQRLTDDEQKILDKMLSDAQQRDISAIDHGEKKKAT